MGEVGAGGCRDALAVGVSWSAVRNTFFTTFFFFANKKKIDFFFVCS